MKKLIILFICALCLASCDSKKNTEEQNNENNTVKAENLPVYTLDSLLAVVDNLKDQKVEVIGYVTHTCKHAGKRCFIVGENENASMRVEAKGDIGGFNRELVGSKLKIAGVIKETRLTKEYIDQMEKEAKEDALEEDGSAETCAAELSNIAEMRSWMKTNGKDYYSIYYMDGTNYDIVSK